MVLGRVVEIWAAQGDGGDVGSGYLVTDGVVLTAGHVADKATTACVVRPLGRDEWRSARVAWRSAEADLALLTFNGPDDVASDIEPVWPVRWGRLPRSPLAEAITATAIGFPAAQERFDLARVPVRDTEALRGFLESATGVKQGLWAVSVVSSTPSARVGGSPWAGMSGAAVFAGPFLVGVVVVDPENYESDRLLVEPVEVLGTDPKAVALLGGWEVEDVSPVPRLAVTADVSIALTAPYRPRGARFGRVESELLLPEFAVVPFVGHEQVDDLVAWCRSEEPAVLRVITGSGGAGKTRLAREVVARMLEQGWQAGIANPDAPGGTPQLELDRPTLIVVDDAERHTGLLTHLVNRMALWPPTAPPVRLLLLARHQETWWDTLRRETRQSALRLADATVKLEAGRLDEAVRNTHFHAAAVAFAKVLDTAAPVTTPHLADAAFENPILVHVDALLAVLHRTPDDDGDVRSSLLAALLEVERARWVGFPGNPPEGSPRPDQSVTVATLTNPPDHVTIVGALTAVPSMRDSLTYREDVAAWLHSVYASWDDQPYCTPVRPDVLSEQLLTECEALRTILIGLPLNDPEPVAHLLTELTRALGRPPVKGSVDAFLAERLDSLVALAADNPSTPLANLIATLLDTCPQPDAAPPLVGLLPEHSTGLAQLAASLTEQAVDALADHQPEERAELLNGLSVRLSDLGRREDALTAIEEAVGLYRQLAQARPDAYLPDLATSINNLSIHLSYLGRREEALTAAQEAAGLYRQLAQALPDVFLPDLAMSLNNLSNRLSDLGRREEALTAIQEAVGLYRQLAQARPDTFLPNLATSLNNLSNHLSGLGRREEALTAIQEAVGLYRQLAQARPDTFLPNLATSLNSLSNRLSGLGHREDALTAAQEAVGLYRQLAQALPDAFLPDLATSLNNLSNHLSGLGRREDALTAIQEAVGLYRQLAQARPDAFLPDLARSLNSLSNRLSGLGHREDALTTAQEAVGLYRQLAQALPDAFLPDLATSLNNLSAHLSDLGRREDALTTAQEAADLRRQLAQARPDTFLPDLAMSLNNLSIYLSGLGHREEALTAAQEAADLYRQLAQARPDVFLPDLAGSLNNLSIHLSDFGRWEEALTAIQGAADLYRQLAQARPDTFLPDLAMSLNNLSNRLSDLGRQEEALTAAQEAADLYRQLAQARPDTFLPNLATSLNNLSNRLSDLGRREDALTAAQEAADLYRELAQARPDAFLPNLATSLNSLSIHLSDLGRREDALTAAQEALQLFTTLARQRPNVFARYVRWTLVICRDCLKALGRSDEASQIDKVLGEDG